MGAKIVIALQNIGEDLNGRVEQFLAQHKRIPSKSQLGIVALETYIALANEYGLDFNWHPNIPNIPPEIFDRSRRSRR